MSTLLRACSCDDIDAIKYPCYVSDKEDGVRASIMESPRTGNRLVGSRTEKPIPNIYIRETIHNSTLPMGVDGELIISNKSFHEIQSAVMSAGGKPDFRYMLMDYYGCGRYVAWSERLKILENIFHAVRYSWIDLIPQYMVYNKDELTTRYNDAISRGKEGVMIRSLTGFYKAGKATIKQQTLMKLKPFIDADAQVVGFEELVFLNKPSTRSFMLGALKCKTVERVDFNIGSGFSDDERKEIWENREKYLYKWLTFKYQKVGTKEAPRTPIFRRWRLDIHI